MCGTARAVLLDFHGHYAYTTSDQISLLSPPEWDLFGRVVEKVTSISAGLATAAFTQSCGEPAHFDRALRMTPGHFVPEGSNFAHFLPI
jgi:tRNA(His) 5'-end guanylyltransferase